MLLPLVLSILLAAICLSNEVHCSTPSCLDDEGNPVDWYIVYKFPVLRKSEAPFNTGYAYAYMTSEDNGIKRQRSGRERRLQGTAAPQWTISNKLITDPDSMILNTLSIAYDVDSMSFSEINSIFYNDAPPSLQGEQKIKPNSRRAHAKGAVVVDESSGDGFWLSHTTPQWPPSRNEQLEYAENSRTPAQTFICLNFDLNKSGRQIFAHLMNMRPLVYESMISPELMSWQPELSCLQPDGFKGKRADGDEMNLFQPIKTRGGQELGLFSKPASFNADIFSDWLDQYLGSNMYVQTWRNGVGGHLDSSCPRGQPQTINVEEMRVVTDTVDINWTYRQDHSKWAISDSEASAVVCLSDVNRAMSQFSRGGGAICIKCPKCWNIFSKTVQQVEPCH